MQVCRLRQSMKRAAAVSNRASQRRIASVRRNQRFLYRGIPCRANDRLLPELFQMLLPVTVIFADPRSNIHQHRMDYIAVIKIKGKGFSVAVSAVPFIPFFKGKHRIIHMHHIRFLSH